MSQSVNILEITFKAEADLSAVQYYVMKVSAEDQVNIPTARTDVTIGVLQNEPKSGENAVIRVAGTTKAKSWSTITRGTYVTATADGRIMTADTDKDVVIGIALESAAADGDIIEILLTQHKASI